MLQDVGKEHMAALIKINNITGYLPLDLWEILRVIARELEGLFNPYKTFFYLTFPRIDEHLESFPPGAQPSEEFAQEDCIRFYDAAEEPCRAVTEQLPVLVYNGRTETCPACRHKGDMQPHICVPLVSGSQAFGTLSLIGSESVILNRDQLELLLALANQTTATIQRARLFDRLAREKEALARLNERHEALNQDLIGTIDQLKTTQHQLILSERLAAAGHLAANFAHEVNNATGIILSRLECMDMEAKEKGLLENVQKDIETIKKHIRRISQITYGLLDLSRQSLKIMTPVAINDLIMETVDFLERQFSDNNVCFRLRLGEAAFVKGSFEHLQQVLINLLTNARDAMPNGGMIEIETGADFNKGILTVDVRDNGIGISRIHVDRIFDPFFTVKEKGAGTGLGLSISYNIVREHGGSITVQSTEGEGTTFTITLPVILSAEEISATP
ncbi:MAG: ATP-binding protein [Peptococcaceae bacterium]|nr:ATP-binding protein [Peptococcaceae bacterium]